MNWVNGGSRYAGIVLDETERLTQEMMREFEEAIQEDTEQITAAVSIEMLAAIREGASALRGLVALMAERKVNQKWWPTENKPPGLCYSERKREA